MLNLNLQRWPPARQSTIDLEKELEKLESLSIRERETQLLEYWHQGFFPKFLRNLQPLILQEGGHSLTVWVAPDYLSLGSDDAPILLPLSFIHAAELARAWDFLLPTAKLVDRIYEAASVKIWPRTFPPDESMSSLRRILEHNRWIQGQRGLNIEPSSLSAGHKKDLVLTRRLIERPQRLALYGWQDIAMGSPIQPLSVWHHAEYVDYSHGIRMIGAYGLLDGKKIRLDDLLMSETLAGLLSSEGCIEVQSLLHPIPAKIW